VVTSAQIEEDADFAVLDKSVYIATVSEAASCKSKCASRTAADTLPPTATTTKTCHRYIPVDSVHSPVRKVNYSVESAVSDK